jgi:hypothetical protein
MQDFSEILRQFGENTCADIRMQMAQQGLGDSKLAKSVAYEVNGNEIKITAAHWYDYAEKGRGPGKVPYNFRDILETWIVSRGIKPRDGNISKFASAIAWTTIKSGSYLYRHPNEQRDFDTEPIQENLDWLKGQVGVYIMNEI